MATTRGVTSADVMANAQAAYAELRAQVTQQIATSGSIDTKAAAVITIISALASLVATRIHVDKPDHVTLAVIAFLLTILVVGLCFIALRPRTMSYGPDASALVTHLSSYPASAIALSIAESMAHVRNINKRVIDTKYKVYEASLLLVFVLLLLLGYMVRVGAIALEVK